MFVLVYEIERVANTKLDSTRNSTWIKVVTFYDFLSLSNK